MCAHDARATSRYIMLIILLYIIFLIYIQVGNRFVFDNFSAR